MNRTKQNVHKHGKIMSVIVSLVVMLSIVPMFGINAFAFTPRTTAPSKDNEYYYSKKNPFYPNYGLPNCTCYAYGRAYEILGKDPKLPTGNAGKWYETDKTHAKGSTPRLGAIACWKGDPSNAAKNGHVAVVEAINGNKISFSESNYGGSVFQYRKDTDPTKYATGAPYNYKFQGYIYLDDVPNIKPGVITGKYYIKNVNTGTYMGVSGGKDADKTNVVVANNDFTSKFVMNVTAKNSNTQDGTSIMPGCSSSRVINGFADDVSDGTNVNLYKKTSDASQCWVWEKSGNNYVIRNAQHTNLVLTVDGTNILLKNYTGAKTQLWTIEEVKALSSIAVTAPAKTTYYVGEKLDTTGMKVTATYDNKSTKDVTSSAKVTCDLSKAGEVTATVSYSENNVSKSATFKVTVKEMPAPPFKGEGTAESPYLISSNDELKAFRDLVNDPGTNTKYGHAFYKQTADIDLENEEWIPIGAGYNGAYFNETYDTTIMFCGSYDGNNHYITNLKQTIKLKATGVFGFLRGTEAAVKNLVVKGNINQTWKDGYYSGGVVGQTQYYSHIENCAFIGDINTTCNAGGITARIWQAATIKNCYHSGSIKAGERAGGIVGYIQYGEYGKDGDDTLIANCYQANGTVTSESVAGAIAGECIYYDGIKNTAHINNCYASSDCNAQATAKNATADTTLLRSPSEMKNAADDLGASFTNNGDTNINNGFPVFPWEVQQAQVTTTTTATTLPVTTTTTTTAEGTDSDLIGDANGDGKVSVADAVAILQFIGNRDKYQLTAKGLKNADVDGVAGITGKDALVLQQVDAGLVNAEDLPLKK